MPIGNNCVALPRFVVYKEQEFSCAHFLREYHGMCERIHGHNYKVRIYVGADELDSEGMVIDYHALKVSMQNVIQKEHSNEECRVFGKKYQLHWKNQKTN